MKYPTTLNTLEAFYDALYSIPARTERKHVTPQTVTGNLLRILGNPEKNFRMILVTGSKGKGSTALFLANLINCSGSRVGRFSSPHLFDFRERIVVDNAMIKPQELLSLASEVFSAANTLPIEHPDEFPRFFEITTAIAYLYFAKRYVDIAVIETGIGALTDATNQHQHELSIITNIEDEHGDIFGSLVSIAKEKSGVIKKETPLILGDLSETIDQIIIEHAATLNAPVTRFKKNDILNNNGFYPVKVGHSVWITDSLVKAKNAWVALQAFAQLGLDLDENGRVEALEKTTLPARQEIVSFKPFIIIDGAHSKESAHSLAHYVKKIVKQPDYKLTLLLSFSNKKNIVPVISAFPDADCIIITQANTSRSIPPEAVKTELATLTHANITVIEAPLTALKEALNSLSPNDVLVITGSLYLAGLVSQQYGDISKSF